MIAVLIVTAVLVLYWFFAITDWLAELLLRILPLDNYVPIYLLRPFSALTAAAPNIYLVFQFVLLAAALICALTVLFSKKFTENTKLCSGISLAGIIAVFFIPFGFSAVLNLCVSIPLLCWVITDYKQSKQM